MRFMTDFETYAVVSRRYVQAGDLRDEVGVIRLSCDSFLVVSNKFFLGKEERNDQTKHADDHGCK
jgi:hypothetical protein